MSNFSKNPLDFFKKTESEKAESQEKKQDTAFGLQKSSLFKKEQNPSGDTKIGETPSRFGQTAKPQSSLFSTPKTQTTTPLSQRTQAGTLGTEKPVGTLASQRAGAGTIGNEKPTSPFATQRAQAATTGTDKPTSPPTSHRTTYPYSMQNDQKSNFDKSKLLRPGEQKTSPERRPFGEVAQRQVSPTQRQDGNIFQRQESSLTLPNVQASSTMSSIKERLEALQKKQGETITKTDTPSTFAKGSFTKNRMAEKKPIAGTSSPLGFNRPAAPATALASSKPSFQKATPTSPRPSALTSPRPSSLTQPGSGTQPNVVGISDHEFSQLSEFLYEKAGIFITESRKYLVENRLSTRLRSLGLRNFSEYVNYLKFDANRDAELNKFFENMTTNETSFFRNVPQLKVFQDSVLATVCNELKAKKQKKLTIWSAGCSSGEEPYTIAMILHEHLKSEINSWDIKITANDLSLAMLDIARKGLYSEYALRTTPQEMIDKYFVKKGNQFEVVPQVKKLVKFGQINFANKAQMSKVEASHIVFCRNVIIYFDNDMKTHVINCFYDNLLSNGYLIIGHSESLHNISRSFVPKHYTNAIIYQKKD